MHSIISTLEAENGSLHEAKGTLIALLDAYKIMNEKTEQNLLEEELSSTATLQEVRRLEN